MNIKHDEYGHQKVVSADDKINKYKTELNYVPTRLEFEEIFLDTPGFFSFADQGSGTISDSTDTLDATIEGFNAMENLIKKNFMMPPEKLEDFANNNPV